MIFRFAICTFLAALSTTTTSLAGQPIVPPKESDPLDRPIKTGTPSAIPMEIFEIKPDLFLITGRGANAVARRTPAGIILVDNKVQYNLVWDEFTTMLSEKVSPLPVRYAFITHHHADHGGLNQKVIDSGAELIGHANLVNILKNYKSVIAPINPAAPSITFTDEYKLDFGGTQTIAYHWGSSHTNADIAVYFKDLKVIAVGDLVYGNALPAVDAHFGHGSLLGMSERLNNLLALDFDIAIPGHGNNPMLRDEVVTYKRQLDDLIRFGSLAIKNGANVDNFIEAMDEQSSDFELKGHFWHEPEGLISIFDELKAHAEDQKLDHTPLL